MACGPINNNQGGCSGAAWAPQYSNGAGDGGMLGGRQVTAGNGGGGSLEQHVNAILADGQDHGFPNGYASFVPRIGEAMANLREKGIVTSTDPYEAMQQASNWLMDNAGSDGVFSFGGGPAGEDDAAALSAASGISRGDINAVKFMFDNVHDAQLTQEDGFLTVDTNNQVFQELAAILVGTGQFGYDDRI